MKRLALGIALGTVVGIAVGVHSSVYACDRAAKARAEQSIAVIPGVTIDVTVPLDHIEWHRVPVTCKRGVICDSGPGAVVQSVRRSARVAATLGRALVTAVGAVVGTLVDAAVTTTLRLE